MPETPSASQCRDIDDFESITQVRLVAAILQHCIGVFQTRQRRLDLDADAFLENVRRQILDDPKHVIHLDEGHLQVELRELRLPIGAQSSSRKQRAI